VGKLNWGFTPGTSITGQELQAPEEFSSDIGMSTWQHFGVSLWFMSE
jgi:hypothetical protein